MTATMIATHNSFHIYYFPTLLCMRVKKLEKISEDVRLSPHILVKHSLILFLKEPEFSKKR